MQLRSAAARSSLIAMLVALLVPATAATASHVDVRSTASACDGAPEDGFDDTGSDGSVFEEAIDCISWYAITGGVTSSTYEPNTKIRRAQMARMVAQSMRQSLTRFPEPGDDVDHFTDDDSSPFEQDIDFVAEYDVVRGTGGTNYSPASFVTRAQMATFLVKQLEAIGAPVPTPDTDYFDDDNESFHEGNINKLAALGIASGTADRSFSPGGHVTRRQMALFISRDLAYLVENDLMVPPDERVEPAEDGAHTNALVATISRNADSFTTSEDDETHGAERFWYDDNDVFQDPDGGDITLAEFDGLLTGPVGETAADEVTVDYAHDPAEESTFQVVTDNVPPATNVTAVAGDYDDDDDRSDVLIFWDASEQPNVLYDVFRDDNACGVAIIAPEDCEVASDLTDTSVILTDEADGDWTYYVVAESPTTGSTSSQATSNEVTVPADASASGRPTSQIAERESGNDSDPNPWAVEGDVWRFVFSEPLAEIEDGDSLRLQDSSGDPLTVEHYSSSFPEFPSDDEFNAEFSLNSETTTVNGTTYAPGRVLTVELSEDLTAGSSNDDRYTYPFTVTYSTGLTDGEGQPVAWPDGAPSTIPAEVNGPAMVSAVADLNGTGPDRITVTYDEDVTCTGDSPGQFEYDPDGTDDGDEIAATGLSCDGDATIVVTFQDGVVSPNDPDDEIRDTQSAPADHRVQDESGNLPDAPYEVGVTN